jgi:NAD(P)-dependent dehydrogenase (short-subunit alcohol dehydrogenase family)
MIFKRTYFEIEDTMAQSIGEMHGKICMVTGATSGIGQVTAQALAGMGATTIIVARNQSRGEATVREIKAKTGNPFVELMLADLSSQAAIRQLAQNFKQEYSRLDVLVNNAGAINLERTVTVDGLENTFATNHLGYFLLTNLLLDCLKASAPSRIINVSSSASLRGKINFDDLQGTKRCSGRAAYSQSKLGNVLFTIALAKKLQGTGVTVNAVHPGPAITRFGMNNNAFWRVVFGSVYRVIGISAEEGAQTQIYLATSPEVSNVTGKYFYKKKAIEPNPLARDDAIAERLWTVSEQLVGLAREPVLDLNAGVQHST